METYFLQIENLDIFDQLKIEEAFLRTSDKNLVIINIGSSEKIVLGISSNVDELINVQEAIKKSVPAIRRYSGGGTVVVNQETIFVTFIFNHEELNLDPYPQKIMEWSAKFYSPLFENLDFALKENDYVIGSKKFGGNAQYLTKKRFVHHSTLLYEINPDLMNVLKLPRKAPIYRENRGHQDFLTSLNSLFASKKIFADRLIDCIRCHMEIVPVELSTLNQYLNRPHRMSTQTINLSNFLHSDLLNQIDQKMLV